MVNRPTTPRGVGCGLGGWGSWLQSGCSQPRRRLAAKHARTHAKLARYPAPAPSLPSATLHAWGGPVPCFCFLVCRPPDISIFTPGGIGSTTYTITVRPDTTTPLISYPAGGWRFYRISPVSLTTSSGAGTFDSCT